MSCPAIPEHLLESEFFGHRRGAFTGADRDHIGLFEEAHGSSLFLDEIGDIPVALQIKLLRVLQEREFKPLGATKNLNVDARILSSTNQDIEAKIQDRSFREDLYYRLNVVTLENPGPGGDQRRHPPAGEPLFPAGLFRTESGSQALHHRGPGGVDGASLAR